MKLRHTFRFTMCCYLLVLVTVFAIQACKYKSPTNPPLPEVDQPLIVTIIPSTNCEATATSGEIRIVDSSASTPAGHITNVNGGLKNSEGVRVCTWLINREGNAESSTTCENVGPSGSYSFEGLISADTGQLPTMVNGSCSI